MGLAEPGKTIRLRARSRRLTAVLRRSTIRSHCWPRRSNQRSSQWRLHGFLRKGMTVWMPGAMVNSGAGRRPATTVRRASLCVSISQPRMPVERTASPRLFEVIKRIAVQDSALKVESDMAGTVIGEGEVAAIPVYSS